MNKPTDPTLALFSNVFGLGERLGLYPVKRFSRWGTLITGLVLAGGGFLTLLGGAAYTLLQINRFGPAVQNNMFSSIFVPAACVGSLLVLFGAAAVWSAYNNWKKAAALYRDGFAYSDRGGVRQFHWNDVHSMTSAVTRHYRNGIYTGTSHIYTLVVRDNQRIILNDALQNVEELAGAIQQNIFPHLYKDAADRFNAGQTVAFGNVSIHKNGITIGKKDYGWEDVQQVTINNGFLTVTRKGGGLFKGAAAAASTVPNLPVLLSIVNQVTGVKTSG